MYRIISYGGIGVVSTILVALSIFLPGYLFPYSFTANEIRDWTIYMLLAILFILFLVQVIFVGSILNNKDSVLPEEEILSKRIQGGKWLLYGVCVVILSIYMISSDKGGDLGDVAGLIIIGLVLVSLIIACFVRALVILLKTCSAGVLVILFLLIGILQVRLAIEVSQEIAWKNHAEITKVHQIV